MVHQNERDELLAAWRALSGSSGSDGWRTIPVIDPTSLRAGRHFPGNEEAVLLGFSSITPPPAESLPQGKGFVVANVELHGFGVQCWFALARRPEGSLDVFTTMVLDVIDALRLSGLPSEDRRFHLFLTRIRAWQDFMRRGSDTILEPQAEIGLFGELITLHSMIDAGLHPAVPVEAWEGPLNGVHDFVIGMGAVEVKTTIAVKGFSAVIETLGQLDDAIRQPLFLAAVRLRVAGGGTSLPALIDNCRMVLGDDPARNTFDTKLLYAGYIEGTAERYQRRFETVEVRVFRVTDGFPRLTSATVPPAIREARYELDIDHAAVSDLSMQESLTQLGAL